MDVIKFLENEKERLEKKIKEIDEEIYYRRKYKFKEKLSEREQQVFTLLQSNLTDAEIIEILGVSKNTVKKHISNILFKLNLKSRYEIR